MRYGLIGKSLSHSYSPAIHRMLGTSDYQLTELEESALPLFFQRRDFNGINVTIPYKKAVIPYLDEIDDKARSIGAVNTVLCQNGRLYGTNTDYDGFSALCRHARMSLTGKRVLILGSGGTSATVKAVAKQEGATEILTVSRHPNGGQLSYGDLSVLPEVPTILVNTTPIGMFPHTEESPVTDLAIPGLCGVLDAVYNPIRTTLVCKAHEQGISAEGGLYMLVAQAVSASVFFGQNSVGETVTDAVYRHLLRQKQNVVLIGMPSCGKTTVAEMLGRMIKRPVIDTDKVLEKQMGMPVSRYLYEKGEEAFRREESRLIASLTETTGHIIATGGGSILNRNNVTALRKNGYLIWLNRPLSDLNVSADRPLSSNRELLENIYRTRYAFYEAAADESITDTHTAQQTAEKIVRMWNE